jgi:hypothetical protein
MFSGTSDAAGTGNWLFLILTALTAGLVSFSVFLGCLYWLRREQRRWQRRLMESMARPGEPGEIFVTGQGMPATGELVAQFKLGRGRKVLSVLEADGRRFIHVDGELSNVERDKLMRYLRSEGFMS